MTKRLASLILSGLSVIPGLTLAEAPHDARARFHYQMFCQGCHTPTGSGHKSVPQIEGHLGLFLGSQQGREYLVRVPGAANAALDDQQLTELLNWMLVTFGKNSTPATWEPYTSDEVAQYRQQPLFEVVKYRQQLVKQLTKSTTEGQSTP